MQRTNVMRASYKLEVVFFPPWLLWRCTLHREGIEAGSRKSNRDRGRTKNRQRAIEDMSYISHT